MKDMRMSKQINKILFAGLFVSVLVIALFYGKARAAGSLASVPSGTAQVNITTSGSSTRYEIKSPGTEGCTVIINGSYFEYIDSSNNHMTQPLGSSDIVFIASQNALGQDNNVTLVQKGSTVISSIESEGTASDVYITGAFGGSIFNKGKVTFSSTDTVSCEGISNEGTIDNDGTEIYVTTYQLYNSGTITSSGLINCSSGFFNDPAGVFTLTSSGSLEGDLENEGSVSTGLSAKITGSIENKSGATLVNEGNIEIPVMGSLINGGEVNNNGKFNCNNATISNQSGAGITNSGEFAVVSEYQLENFAAFINAEGGLFTTSGTIDFSANKDYLLANTASEFVNYGTLSAPNGITLIDDARFTENDKAVYEIKQNTASCSFVKGSGDLEGTVKVGGNVSITSSGGTFYMSVDGGERKAYSGSITGVAAASVTPVLLASKATLTGVKDLYVGQTVAFSASADAGYDGGSDKVYVGYADSDYSLPSQYSREAPTTEGTYYATAIAEETSAYAASMAVPQKFTITSLPLTECATVTGGGYLSVSGVSNDIYIKDKLTLTPASGYSVKMNGTSEYVSVLELSQSDLWPGGIFDSSVSFSLKVDDSSSPRYGAVTTDWGYEKVVPSLGSFIFDSTPPEFAATATADGQSVTVSSEIIRAKELAISVSDANLDKVVVSGISDENQSFEKTSETTGLITIKPVSGSVQTAVLTAYDKAGNTATLDVSIQYPRQKPVATVTMADILVGQECKPELSTDSDGSVSFVYSDEKDGTYSSAAPASAGTYWVKAKIEETDSFEAFVTDPVSFEIKKNTVGESRVEVADTYVGMSYEPVVTTDSDGKDLTTFEYKGADESDSAYTSQKPASAGSYVVRATIPKTESFEKIVVTGSFTISRYTPKAVVTIMNVPAGVDYQPAVSTDSDSTEEVKFAYRKKGVENSTYTVVKPILPGTYYVQATIARTDKYESVSAEAEFTISYLETPKTPYSVSGTRGEGNFYRSDVYLKAPEGYNIAKDENGTWVELLPYENGIKKIYLKRSSDGALTDAVNVNETIKIDKSAPELKKAVDQDNEEVEIKDGGEIYADVVRVKIKDDNLKSVTVDGEDIEIAGDSATFRLSCDDDSKKFKIVAKDKAGNKLEITCTVISSWQKNGVVPSGKKIRLKKGKKYKLDSGKWKLSGDPTSYSGGITVYVKATGEYTLTKE